jgi:hypothetical protein
MNCLGVFKKWVGMGMRLRLIEQEIRDCRAELGEWDEMVFAVLEALKEFLRSDKDLAEFPEFKSKLLTVFDKLFTKNASGRFITNSQNNSYLDDVLTTLIYRCKYIEDAASGDSLRVIYVRIRECLGVEPFNLLALLRSVFLVLSTADYRHVPIKQASFLRNIMNILSGVSYG